MRATTINMLIEINNRAGNNDFLKCKTSKYFLNDNWFKVKNFFQVKVSFIYKKNVNNNRGTRTIVFN